MYLIGGAGHQVGGAGHLVGGAGHLVGGADASFRVAAAPGLEPRLLRADGGRESAAEYGAAGGFIELPPPERLLDAVELAGLRGRGGAAFPTAIKLRTVRAAGGPPVVVANGEEGEPASVKDRWLLRYRPHLVLDGVRIAAGLVGADVAFVYVSDAEAGASVEEALRERPVDGVEVRVHRVEPAYVAGEESAAVRALNGGPAKPTEKPPRPYESGVWGRPTLVSNVETLANLPFVAAHGAGAFRAQGTDRAPGTFLLTLTGAVARPGLYEVPLGISLGEALHELGGGVVGGVEGGVAGGVVGGVMGGVVGGARIGGALMGGYFAGLLGPAVAGAALDYDSLLARGSGLGCGAIGVLGADQCPVAVAADVMAYFAVQNAGQCGSCFNGTAAMSAALGALREGIGTGTDLERLERWSQVLRGRGACATLDGAATLAGSLIREYREQAESHVGQSHVGRSCAGCAAPAQATPFAVGFASPIATPVAADPVPGAVEVPAR